MKMVHLMQARYWWLYIVLIFLFLGLVYRDYLAIYFFFDVHAPDLAKFDGLAIKQELLNSERDLNIALFNLGFYQSFLLPIAISFLAFPYLQIKNCSLRHSIGKEAHYLGLKRQLAWKLSLLPCLLYLVVLAVIVMVSWMGSSFSSTSFATLFSKESWLQLLFSTEPAAAFFFLMLTLLAIFINALFFLKIVDVTKHATRGSMAYLMLIWMGSMLLYHLLPYFFVPMTSLMQVSYGNVDGFTIWTPYLLYAVGYWGMTRYEENV